MKTKKSKKQKQKEREEDTLVDQSMFSQTPNYGDDEEDIENNDVEDVVAEEDHDELWEKWICAFHFIN